MRLLKKLAQLGLIGLSAVIRGSREVLLLCLLVAVTPVVVIVAAVTAFAVIAGRGGKHVRRVSDATVRGAAVLLVPFFVLCARVWEPVYRRRRTWRWILTQIAFLAITAGALGVFAVWPLRSSASPWWSAMPLSLLAIGGALAYFFFQTHDHPRHDAADVLEVPDVQDIELDWQTLVASAHLLRSPAAYTHRLVHEVSPGTGYMSIQVTREMTLPYVEAEHSSHKYFIPLVYIQRGTLVDGLSTHSSDNIRVPIVSSSIARGLTWKLLAYLTFELFDGVGLADDERVVASLRQLSRALVTDATLPAAVEMDRARNALTRLAELKAPPAGPGLPTPLHRRRRGAVSALTEEQLRDWEVGRESLLQLWEAAYTSYVVYAEVERPKGAQLSISVAYSKPLEDSSADEGDEGIRASLRDNIRRMFGVLPYIYRFALEYERATRSYHLRFVASSDQYVSRAEVRRRPLYHEPTDGKAHLVVARTDDSSTMNYTHVYVRPLRNVTNVGELRIRLGMRERPPGVLGLVALVGTVQLVLDILVLAAHRRFFGGTDHSDVPALLLATPGLISAWMANQITPGRLQRMPTTAVAGIAWNGFAAIAAVALAVISAYGADVSKLTIGHFTVSYPLWLSFIFLSVVMVGNVTLRWAQNTYIFVNRLRRGPTQERYAV